MFTGIVQAVGTVTWSGSRLHVTATWPEDHEPIQAGESVAVNGCCLTTTVPGKLEFDLSPETLSRTMLSSLSDGDAVNLERALRVGDRLGGHWVQGHVDAVGEILSIEVHESGSVMRLRVPDDGIPFLLPKGSLTVNGISLTIVNPSQNTCEFALIPHTIAHTNLAQTQPGDPTNLEYDILAKMARTWMNLD